MKTKSAYGNAESVQGIVWGMGCPLDSVTNRAGSVAIMVFFFGVSSTTIPNHNTVAGDWCGFFSAADDDDDGDCTATRRRIHRACQRLVRGENPPTPVTSAFGVGEFNVVQASIKVAFDRHSERGSEIAGGFAPGRYTADTDAALRTEWARLKGLSVAEVLCDPGFDVSVAHEETARVPTGCDTGYYDPYLFRPSPATDYVPRTSHEFSNFSDLVYMWAAFMFHACASVYIRDERYKTKFMTIPGIRVDNADRNVHPALLGRCVYGYPWERVHARGLGNHRGLDAPALVDTAVKLLQLAVYDALLVFVLNRAVPRDEWMALRHETISTRCSPRALLETARSDIAAVQQSVGAGGIVPHVSVHVVFGLDGPAVEDMARANPSDATTTAQYVWGHDFDSVSGKNTNIGMVVRSDAQWPAPIIRVITPELPGLDGRMLCVSVFLPGKVELVIMAYRADRRDSDNRTIPILESARQLVGRYMTEAGKLILVLNTEAAYSNEVVAPIESGAEPGDTVPAGRLCVDGVFEACTRLSLASTFDTVEYPEYATSTELPTLLRPAERRTEYADDTVRSMPSPSGMIVYDPVRLAPIKTDTPFFGSPGDTHTRGVISLFEGV